MQIGEVSRRLGLSEHTLRYYEKMGLIAGVRRDSGGHRMFTPDDIRWLELLVKLRSTRMPLRQMRRYAEMVREGDASLPERHALLLAHERKVRSQIEEMIEALAVVRGKIEMYQDKMAVPPAAKRSASAR